MPTLDEVKSYWKGRNIPQIWYSQKEPLTLQWFNEIRQKRYRLYYEYLTNEAEFNFHSGEKVLEVGCGLGTDLAEFAQNGAKVYGVDLGVEQIELTKLNFHLRNLNYEILKPCNAENLDFEDNYFDFVFSFGVLHHTPDTDKAISEVYRVLNNGGSAIIMLYAKGWKHYIKRCLIHGVLKFKIFKYKFNWQKVYDEVSEVNGFSPKTNVYSKKGIKKLFNNYNVVFLKKKRLGEFFDYPPYNTIKFPGFIKNIFDFLNLEALIGENWIIKISKSESLPKGSFTDVLFNKY